MPLRGLTGQASTRAAPAATSRAPASACGAARVLRSLTCCLKPPQGSQRGGGAGRDGGKATGGSALVGDMSPERRGGAFSAPSAPLTPISASKLQEGIGLPGGGGGAASPASRQEAQGKGLRGGRGGGEESGSATGSPAIALSQSQAVSEATPEKTPVGRGDGRVRCGA